MSGVSIIIPTLNAAAQLETLLHSFFQTNTCTPLELIILDHGSTDNTRQIAAGYAGQGLIRYFAKHNTQNQDSFPEPDQGSAHDPLMTPAPNFQPRAIEDCNYGACRARYPYLLFLQNNIVFNNDILSSALVILEQEQDIGALGIALQADRSSLTRDDYPPVLSSGRDFVWDEKPGCFKAEQIRPGSAYTQPDQPETKNKAARSATGCSMQNDPKTNGQYCHAVSSEFLLCRKADFDHLGGFSTGYEYGLKDLDFCLRLVRDLNKKCFCVNEPGLQKQPGPDNISQESYDAFSRDLLKLNKKYSRELFRYHLQAHAHDSDPALDQNENAGLFKVHKVIRDEDLLRRNKWRSLRSGNAHPGFAPPDLSAGPPIGWVQPHLNMCGGIRHVIEMSNRLSDWGAEFYLITPQGIKTDWLPIKSRVISQQDAISINFGTVIVSDPVCIRMFESLNKQSGLFYHLHAYMLYRSQDEDLNRYYQLANQYPNICNSHWTAWQLMNYSDLKSWDVLPCGVNKDQFRPYIVPKVHDTSYFGAKNRPFKATQELKQYLTPFSQLALAEYNLPQKLLAPAICSSRSFVSGSYFEGFNLCPLEAMACGVPVVMTDCGGSREYARNEENALVVDPKNYKALQEQVYRLLKDRSLRLRLIENGMETAWRFDWDPVTQKLARILSGEKYPARSLDLDSIGSQPASAACSLSRETTLESIAHEACNAAGQLPSLVCQFTPAKPRNPFYQMIGNELQARGLNFKFSTDQKQCLAWAQEQRSRAVFHFHQLEPFYHVRSGNRAESQKKADQLLDFLYKLKNTGVRLVWTKHDPQPHHRELEAIDTCLEHKALQHFDHVLVLAQGALEILARQLPAAKISFIPHPEYRSFYGAPVNVREARKKHGLPAEGFVFGNIGEIKPYKGLELIIEAFTRLSTRSGREHPLLLLAGRPGPGYTKYLQQLQSMLPANSILVPEDIHASDMASWIGCLDASVFAFRDIWVSGSVILSLSYRKPVIVPDIGFLREYAGHNNTGYFYDHQSVESLTEAMDRMLNCSDYTFFKDQCDLFVQNHKLETIADSYLSLYCALVRSTT